MQMERSREAMARLCSWDRGGWAKHQSELATQDGLSSLPLRNGERRFVRGAGDVALRVPALDQEHPIRLVNWDPEKRRGTAFPTQGAVDGDQVTRVETLEAEGRVD